MQLHELQRATPNKRIKRVGRGGSRGKTSGRGTKGQKARAGHSIRPDVREQLKKLPKLRGRGKNSNKTIQKDAAAVNVSALERFFMAGESVTPAIIIERGLVRGRRGKQPVVKILGDGNLSKKLTITGCTVSATAKAKIEAAGGSVGS